jgi:hypothetical protein
VNILIGLLSIVPGFLIRLLILDNSPELKRGVRGFLDMPKIPAFIYLNGMLMEGLGIFLVFKTSFFYTLMLLGILYVISRIIIVYLNQKRKVIKELPQKPESTESIKSIFNNLMNFIDPTGIVRGFQMIIDKNAQIVNESDLLRIQYPLAYASKVGSATPKYNVKLIASLLNYRLAKSVSPEVEEFRILFADTYDPEQALKDRIEQSCSVLPEEDLLKLPETKIAKVVELYVNLKNEHRNAGLGDILHKIDTQRDVSYFETLNPKSISLKSYIKQILHTEESNQGSLMTEEEIIDRQVDVSLKYLRRLPPS